MDTVLGDINVGDPTAGADSDEDMADIAPRAVQKQEKKKKDKKHKKRAHEDGDGAAEGKKKKKKSKQGS